MAGEATNWTAKKSLLGTLAGLTDRPSDKHVA